MSEAFAPQAVTLTLEDEIDVSRGDMLVRPGNVPRVEQKFEAMVVWMAEEPMVPGKSYWIKQTSRMTPGTINTLRYQIDVNTLHRKDAPTLGLNEIGRCTITTSQPICFDSYRRNRQTGAIIVIDRLTNSTVGAGMILDRATEGGRHDHWDDQPAADTLHGERTSVSDAERQARFGQQPVTVLFTGLTGSGKTTLAYALERKLFDQGRAVVVLDGQNMRRGISKDLGFTADERSENLRRSAEVARLFNDAGIIVLAAFLAPDEAIRQKAADRIGRERFLVVHLDCPLEVCRQRDTEGHYQKADTGEIAMFPGITSPYEPPARPDLKLATDKLSAGECIEKILALLDTKGVV
jgi:bifunctional enzyme CysN/CysC